MTRICSDVMHVMLELGSLEDHAGMSDGEKEARDRIGRQGGWRAADHRDKTHFLTLSPSPCHHLRPSISGNHYASVCDYEDMATFGLEPSTISFCLAIISSQRTNSPCNSHNPTILLYDQPSGDSVWEAPGMSCRRRGADLV
jgi:hypothetical protein